MNSLGRGWRSCAMSLQHYHRGVRRLRQHARHRGDAARLRAQLQQLLFDLEVDVSARSGAAGRARMTEVEQRLLYPTLVAVRHTLEDIATSDAAAHWESPLTRALATLRGAIQPLREWRVGHVPAVVREA